MEIEIVSIERLFVYLVGLARVTAMIGALPIFTASKATVRIRLGISAAVSLLIFPFLETTFSMQQTKPLGLVLIILQETLLGLLIGLVVQLVFFAVQFGASLVGYQMGLSAAEVLDPQNNQQAPVLSHFYNVLALLIFLALDIHHDLLRVIVRSFSVLPPGQVHFSGNAVPAVSEMLGEMLVLGLQLSAPALVALMLSTFILGIMSRVFAQLQVFMLSFPVNISLALIVIGLGMGMAALVLEREFQGLQQRLLNILQLV